MGQETKNDEVIQPHRGDLDQISGPQVHLRGTFDLKSSGSNISATYWQRASYVTHMKDIHVPFHMRYGPRNDRDTGKKKEVLWQTQGRHQNMIIKRLDYGSDFHISRKP